MPDIADWKKKYRDSVLEMEREEKRWHQVEHALRRLIGRLCAAAMGADPQLDDELLVLAAANRHNADAAELEKLAASLTSAVIAVDSAAPFATTIDLPTKRWDATLQAVARILQALQAVHSPDAAAPVLLAELALANTDADLAAVLDKTVDMVHRHRDALASERVQTAAVLAEVTKRLEEVSGFLEQAGHDVRTRFDDTASVNDNVISQVRELSAAVNSAKELRTLQTLVNTQLETVTRQVLAFRSREENRLLEQTSRADRMRARIADLERETQDLHSKLDQEKFGARTDPLTGLSNRKSFDERMAQELSRSAPATRPVTLLLWDVDNFKLVNDTYGHRAGDRVLQSVAKCFIAGLRAVDFVARIGGEEFVVLLNDIPHAKAREIADELRRGVEALRFHFRGAPVRVTISCGLTDLKSADSAAAVFDRADAALYQAKNSGKNTCIAA